ncbi:pectate lyase family protein [Actinomadura kijaniata]|uniref:pectate lyase family protein n=1 Tax=Actinomadura kijaniata TaxID=46161 RepID=UPI000A76936F|nr:right-handed parallel beta-helix repeat-containing protein [Actinomadura kijaniata]
MIKTSLSVGTLALAALAAAGSALPSASAQVRAPMVQANAESAPVGYASMNGGTTGGAGGATVTVGNAADFVRYATSAGPYVIRVNGTITLSGMQDVASNKTIIGVGTSGRITGGGLDLDSVRNVVIRNLTFTGAGDDAINVQDGSTNIWIDHNDLSNAKDGLIDIKRGSDFVTVSWNRLHHQDKSMLLGHSDGNASQDTGKLRVTYVHNWLDGTTQRHPRVRFANPVHVFNNYYVNNSGYGAASTENAGVLVENNYFENVEEPTSIQEGSSDPGNIRAVGNHLVNSGTPVTRNPGAVKAVPYSYTAEAGSTVKATVTAGAGVGRI